MELVPAAEDHPGDNDRVSFYEKLLDSLFDGVYFVDLERKISYWNQGSENLTGYSAAEAVGRHCYDNFLAHVDGKGCPLCTGGCPLSQTMQDGERREAEVFLRHKSGHRLPVCVRAAPLRSPSGNIVGAVEVFSDVSAKEQAERRARELEKMAFRDSLTSLPNRRNTELKVRQALEECQEFGRAFGVLMLDIDHFKQINDLRGHDAGDAVLKAVSETLAKSFRESDIVGRWGGEEFVALLADVDQAMLHDLAERSRLLVASSRAMRGSDPLSVTISLGATLLTRSDSPDSVIQRADHLMYLSKARGRNRTTLG